MNPISWSRLRKYRVLSLNCSIRRKPVKCDERPTHKHVVCDYECNEGPSDRATTATLYLEFEGLDLQGARGHELAWSSKVLRAMCPPIK